MSNQPLMSDAAAETVLTDRRRNGRHGASAALIPLLRNPVGDDAGLRDRDDEDCATVALPDGDAGRALVFGVLFSLPLWAVIIEVVRLVVR